jgi:hypothetical protein
VRLGASARKWNVCGADENVTNGHGAGVNGQESFSIIFHMSFDISHSSLQELASSAVMMSSMTDARW